MSQNFDFSAYNSIKRLGEAELAELWGEFFKDKTQKEVRDKLIVQHIYLIRYVVSRVKVTLPATISLEDITGYGVEGLINAIERYSPQKNTRFETYALIRIRGAILDRIRADDFLPRSIRKKIKEIKLVQEELKQELGRMPTTSEVAERTGMEAEKINKILAEEVTMTSIYDKKGASEDSIEIIDTIEDESKMTPEQETEDKDVKKQLENALKRLPERERSIMVLYYQKNMTLKEIGETLALSESRTCQLHAAAIMKLKNTLSEDRGMRRSIV